jgi:hypothetical protein
MYRGQRPVKRTNQSQKEKFFAMRDSLSQTHPHITEWFETGTRGDKAEIIQNCFKKEGQVWKLDASNPFFKESKQRCVWLLWDHGSSR